MDMSPYRELFIFESREHLGSINRLVINLERDPADRETLDSIFRVAHSVKGMAAAMGYGYIAELAHKLEDLMDRIRIGQVAFDCLAADLLLEGTDLLEQMIGDVEKNVTDSRNGDQLIRRLIAFPETDFASTTTPDTGQNATTKPISQDSPRSRDENQRPVNEAYVPQTVRVRTEVLDSLVNLAGELITNKSRLLTISDRLQQPDLNEACQELTRLLRSLHHQVMTVRLVPLAAVTDRFPKIIRDLAKNAGKDIAFEVDGRELELDRSILEALSSPLLHIVRNAVDHGIEPPPERTAAHKPAQGRIRLSAHREKDMVVITVEDDGRGMDPDRLIAAARAKGLIGEDEGNRLSPRDALMLTCLPGFSTASAVTEVSGRGVGMDAVKSVTESIGGKLVIESVPERGSRVLLKIPTSTAIIQALILCCGGMNVAVPITGITCTYHLKRDLILERDGHRAFLLGQDTIPILSLHHLLHREPVPQPGEELSLLICEIRGCPMAFTVDSLLFQQELYVKPLGRPLSKLKGLLGGATLGNGEVIFILDLPNML